MTAALDLLTKPDQGMEFPAEAYAYVGDPSEPDTWMLRLWETPEIKVTAAQVARTVAVLSGNFLGMKLAAIPQDAMPAVKSRVLNAWLATHADCQDMAPGVLVAAKQADLTTVAASVGPLGKRPPLEQDANGNYIVRGLSVFKVGPFVDANGNKGNFTPDDLRAMVDNFHALRDSGVFEDVPGREDHTRTIQNVTGYVTNAYTDGVKLYVDFQFTRKECAELYANGTYRNRSVEAGPYEMNDGNTLFPVLKGFAFCDIPAVEGLNGSAQNDPNKHEETPVEITVNGVKHTDLAAAQAAIQKLEAAKVTPPATFQCNGADVTDPTKVQAHINHLEENEATAKQETRAAFVATLVDKKQLLAAKRDEAVEFVKGLSDEMFESYKAQWDGVPANAAFERHASGGNGNDENQNGGKNEAAEKIAVLEETVRMHVNAGMPADVLAKQPSFVKLQKLAPESAVLVDIAA